MGGQTGSQQQQTQQVTQLPPWINDAAQKNYAFAENVASRPLQQYQGQMVPDVSPQLQQSWNTAATAGNAGMPQYNAATAGYAGALGQTPMSVSAGGPTMQVSSPGNANAVAAGNIGSTNLQSYMNPYTQSVINASLPIMQQQLGQSLATNAGSAVNQGAFGGSRFGVQQGVAQAQGALGEANMAAGLNQANFAQAQAAATGDINRQLQAQTTNQASQQTDLARQMQGQLANQGANAADIQRAFQAQTANQQAQQAKIQSDISASQGLAGVGTNMQGAEQQAYNQQAGAGATQMGQAQSQINAQIQKFQQAWGYPTQQLGALQSALGMTPYGKAQTGESDTQTQTPFDWGALAGQGLNLASKLPMFGVGSDRRLKKNLQPLGADPATGIPIHAFNWKGDPPGAPKALGPMAQDIAKVLPGAVAPHPATGMLHVHPAVLGALAKPAPAGTIGAMAMGKPTPMMKTQHRQLVRPPQVAGALSG